MTSSDRHVFFRRYPEPHPSKNLLHFHAILVILFFLNLGAVTRAHAQRDPGSRDDSLTSGPVQPVNVFEQDSLVKSPLGAILRSAVVPGWGQFYNGSHKKIFVFLAADLSMLGMYVYKDRRVSDLRALRSRARKQRDNDPFIFPEKEAALDAAINFYTGKLDGALDDRNQYGWYLAIFYLLGIVDAYIDAHLFQFDEKIENLGNRSVDVDFGYQPGPGESGRATVTLQLNF